jgi:CheY-like chemotaxis protein
MPGMDGAELAVAIKADPALAGAALVMLTSVGHLGEVKMLEGSGIDACLTKPVRQSYLLNTLTTTRSRRMQAAAPAHKEAAAGAGAIDLKLAHPPRTLVVEDNAVNQKVAVRMLERLGLRADVAANGREAVEMCHLVPYELIFMDCQMPEMDGYAAAREIRLLESRGRQPATIIAMTAEAMAGTREECLAAGMDDYIAKPVKFDHLREAVKFWANRAPV